MEIIGSLRKTFCARRPLGPTEEAIGTVSDGKDCSKVKLPWSHTPFYYNFEVNHTHLVQ